MALRLGFQNVSLRRARSTLLLDRNYNKPQVRSVRSAAGDRHQHDVPALKQLVG